MRIPHCNIHIVIIALFTKNMKTAHTYVTQKSSQSFDIPSFHHPDIFDKWSSIASKVESQNEFRIYYDLFLSDNSDVFGWP